jgi:hypothetical protein
MTFTTGQTIQFNSNTNMSFWSNVSMRFGTGIRIQFIEVFNGNGLLEPCDVIQIIWPVGYQPAPCDWFEVLDPMGNPMFEFHIDQQYGPQEWHVDQIWPPAPGLPLPPQPCTAEKKIKSISPCDHFVVHWPLHWYPPVCSWWEIINPETGNPSGYEFHVDWNNESCEFHVDEVIPGPYLLPFPWYEIEARQKLKQIAPCNWFVIIDPAGFTPRPNTWWEVLYQDQPTGLEFHVDQARGDGTFHVDQVLPDPLIIPPTYPTKVRMKVDEIKVCQNYKVDDVTQTPKPCTWWKVILPESGDVEFHVDASDLNTGIFHVDEVLPTSPVPLSQPADEVIAEKKFTGIGPCDWFKVIDPQSWVPSPCSWWNITWPTQWAGVTFHVDSNDGISKFHIDAADPLPLGPTPPPWNVTAKPAEPPSGPWYVKPAYPDYAPSGMPDFDEKQDVWGPGPGTYTWCGPVAAANSLWWLDSKYETGTIPPPTISDNFGLVTAYGQWDDHDPQNVDPLVRNLAFLMDTDGQRSHDGHTGTRVEDLDRGIRQYLALKGMTAAFEVHNASFPEFQWIEDEVEKCQDVELFLEFWQWTGTSWQKLYDNPSLEAGHFVTCAGVNSTSLELLISDPYQDAYEAHTDPKGRSPVPHPYPHPSSFHNDAQYVSQDAYGVRSWIPPPPSPYPSPVWELVGYLQTLGYNPTWHAFMTAAVATSPLGVHDVAVTNVTTSKTGCSPRETVGQGNICHINVTVQNQGNFTESFNVTAYANATSIKSQNITLVSGASTILTFTWNTTGFAYNNYTISAVADTVYGETETLDNTYTNGTLHVGIPGDINGDRKVDVKDVYAVGKAYGTSLEGPNPPGRTYSPNCDINCDYKVDVKDYYIPCKNYGLGEP